MPLQPDQPPVQRKQVGAVAPRDRRQVGVRVIARSDLVAGKHLRNPRQRELERGRDASERLTVLVHEPWIGVVVVQEPHDASVGCVPLRGIGDGRREQRAALLREVEHGGPRPLPRVVRPVVGQVETMKDGRRRGARLGEEQGVRVSLLEDGPPMRPERRPSPLHAPGRVHPEAVDAIVPDPMQRGLDDHPPHLRVAVVQVGESRGPEDL